jgi:ATP-binding cassette subfamily B protein
VKIAILRDSQGAAELLVAVLTNLPQAIAALVAIGLDVSASGSGLAFVLGVAIFFLSRLLSLRASRRVGGASAAVARSDAGVLAEIGEKLGHLEDLRLLGARSAGLAEVAGAANEAARARRALAEAMAVAGQSAGIVTALAPLVVLMTLAVSHAEVAPTEVARLLVAVPLLVGRLGAVDAIRVAVVEKRPVLAGVMAILELPPSPSRAPVTFGLGEVDGAELGIESVTFQPPGAPRSLLDHVTLTFPSGAFVGVCGTSGGGKSTLLRLLLRLDEPTSGRVTLGGRPLAELDPEELPALFSVATQGSRLLQRSVEANLALGRGGADVDARDASRRALVAAQIPELSNDDGLARKFVRSPPSLSGGEERRVVVARAIAKPTRAIVLDEPEAGLPRATARAMFEAIAAERGTRSLIVVTHAPDLLPGATLVVLDAGKVVGQGSHAELLATCPVYAKLYGGDRSTAPAEQA